MFVVLRSAAMGPYVAREVVGWAGVRSVVVSWAAAAAGSVVVDWAAAAAGSGVAGWAVAAAGSVVVVSVVATELGVAVGWVKVVGLVMST